MNPSPKQTSNDDCCCEIPNTIEEYLELVRDGKIEMKKPETSNLEALSIAVDSLCDDMDELHQLEIGNTLVEHGEEILGNRKKLEQQEALFQSLKARIEALENLVREFRIKLNNSILAR